MKFRCSLLFLLIAFSFAVSAQQAANFFRRVDSGWGLSNNQINTVFADSEGFLWLATVSGLNRYDGYTFRVFKNDPMNPASLPDNSILDIFEDHEGYLWMLTNNEVFIYNPALEAFGTSHLFFDLNPVFTRTGIRSVRADGEGNTWVGNSQTGLWFYDGAKKELRQFYHRRDDAGSPSSNRVMDVVVGRDDRLYVAHANGVVDVMDRNTLQVVHRMDMGVKSSLPEDERDFRLFVDADEHLWLFSPRLGQELYHYHPQKDEVLVFKAEDTGDELPGVSISAVVEDDAGKVWVGTDHGGIYLLNKDNHHSTVLRNVPGDATSLSANSITSLCRTEDGIIWVGTFKNGVNYYHPELFQFELYRTHPALEDRCFSNDVNCFAEDGQGNLWIGTNDDGLVYFDREERSFTQYRHEPGNPNSLSNNVVVSLCFDSKGRLWIGTYQGGLNRFEDGRFKRYVADDGVPSSLSDNRVWQIVEDEEERIWVGTLGGGLELYDERNDAFIHHRGGDFNSIDSDYVLSMSVDRVGNLWVGTSSGLNVLEVATGRFRRYAHEAETPGSLSHPHVLSIQEDAAGRIWVGTRNGLNLLDSAEGTFRVFREEDGLPDHNIISMQPDDKGNLWISTLNGLSNLKVNAAADTFLFRNYDVLDGLQGREFNEHASLRLSSGELVFGGANGFNIFDPDAVVAHRHRYPVVLTNLSLHNQRVSIGEVHSNRVLLSKALNKSEHISLKHNQNVFSIEFSALNYFHPERTRFRYMLEGFNEQWIETGADNRSATYTNLNPGTYTFRLMAAASDGSWTGNEEARLEVLVIPPFYATAWAYGVYFVLFVLLVLLLTRIIRRRAEMKYLRQQEHHEYERMRDLDAMKLRFFTNVSHEFRTPLTLILTPAERLLKQVDDVQLKGQLELIQRNARRLLNLVNQLLDFRKLEVDNIKLSPAKGDLVQFIEDTCRSFSDLFDSKQIVFSFEREMPTYLTHFDHDKMEKIVFNLLSNAAKFTPEGGRVAVALEASVPGEIILTVKDSGVGVPKALQDKVFERFFQNPDNEAAMNQGSGIGLSLCSEFVKMHGGEITLDSEVGRGSCFKVRLPLPEERIEKPGNATAVADNEAITSPLQETEDIPSDPSRPLVLVVEDNHDLRRYLCDNLSASYRVLEAAEGETAWKLAVEQRPQLVVSDIMMPGTDGIALCKRLKADQRTSHIPVVLLTARSSEAHKLEGLEAGAEDYITKPFNYEILELKLERLIALRNDFQRSFAQKFEIKPGEIGITSLDEKFLKRALKTVEKNIGNSEFSVEKMGKELGVSRGHLYNKLVALTGKTPVEFIRIMRLKRAAQYLEKSQLSVSEIAYEVGFNDPKYFSRYFKEEFGMVPSEYAKLNYSPDNQSEQ